MGLPAFFGLSVASPKLFISNLVPDSGSNLPSVADIAHS